MNPEIIPSAPVDVWLIERSGPAEIERWADLLSPEERSRAERFRYPGDREVYIAVHGALREILGGILGVVGFDFRIDGRLHGFQLIQMGLELVEFSILNGKCSL